MKYVTLIILIFISMSCFAMDQKLIDGARSHDVAVKNLNETYGSMSIAYESLKYWSKNLEEAKNSRNLSDDIIQFYQDKILERNKQLRSLDIQYIEAKKMIEKYEPIKQEHDKQIEIERKWNDLKTAILNITGMLILPLSIFFLALWGMIRYHKKCKRLLREGKITQEEYDRMTQSSHAFSDSGGVNSATGLPMTGIGISDVGGNVRGSSSSSALNASQNYIDSSRW